MKQKKEKLVLEISNKAICIWRVRFICRKHVWVNVWKKQTCSLHVPEPKMLCQKCGEVVKEIVNICGKCSEKQ